MELLFGFITGISFGFLLQKGRVLRHEVQIGFLTFKDMTIIKFMFSAIIVGMIGITLCEQLGLISFKVKGLSLGAQTIGGLLFGIGWAIFGYCPGTAIGAVGEGRIHALAGIMGMILGAGLYAEIYPFLRKTVISYGQSDIQRIPELLHINQWIAILIFVVGIFILFFALERQKR